MIGQGTYKLILFPHNTMIEPQDHYDMVSLLIWFKGDNL